MCIYVYTHIWWFTQHHCPIPPRDQEEMHDYTGQSSENNHHPAEHWMVKYIPQVTQIQYMWSHCSWFFVSIMLNPYEIGLVNPVKNQLNPNKSHLISVKIPLKPHQNNPN